jgi:UDP-glucose 4-epimerase
MRVVVTGATGNVGSAVLEALAADEGVTEVVGVARRVPSPLDPKVSYVAADVARDDIAQHFTGADAVIHLAWMFQPTHRPEVTWAANVGGSARVFDAAVEAGVSTLVYASSVGAYSPAPGSLVDESWPTHSLPTASYGREKAYVERLLDTVEARHPDLRVARLRPAFIFQRRAATEQRRIFAGPLMPTSLLRPGRLPVLPWPRGLQLQTVHARDVAEAYRLAVRTDSARGAFNVAAEPVLDGAAMGDLLGTRPVPVPRSLARGTLSAAWHLHAVPAEPALLDLVSVLPILDTTRVRTELGWAPRYTAHEAMRSVLEGMVEHAGGETPTLAGDSLHGRMQEVATGVGERYSTDDRTRAHEPRTS